MSPRPLKIVFSMRHSGALRNFSSTVEELAGRGHRHPLIFMRRDKLGESACWTSWPPRLGDHLREPTDKMSRPWTPLAGPHALGWRLRSLSNTGVQDAQALRDRATRHLSPSTRRLIEWPLLRTRAGLTFLTRSVRLVERAIPADPFVLDMLRSQAPDLVLVTPLVDFASAQEEYVKAARTLAIPSALCVHAGTTSRTRG